MADNQEKEAVVDDEDGPAVPRRQDAAFEEAISAEQSSSGTDCDECRLLNSSHHANKLSPTSSLTNRIGAILEQPAAAGTSSRTDEDRLQEMRSLRNLLNWTINKMDAGANDADKHRSVVNDAPEEALLQASDSARHETARALHQASDRISRKRPRYQSKHQRSSSANPYSFKRFKTRDASPKLAPTVSPLNKADILAVMEIMDAGMHEVANRAYGMVDDLVDMANTGVEEVVNMAQGGVIEVVQMAQTGMGEIMSMAQKGVHDVVDTVDSGISEVMRTAKASLQQGPAGLERGPIQKDGWMENKRRNKNAFHPLTSRKKSGKREKGEADESNEEQDQKERQEQFRVPGLDRPAAFRKFSQQHTRVPNSNFLFRNALHDSVMAAPQLQWRRSDSDFRTPDAVSSTVDDDSRMPSRPAENRPSFNQFVQQPPAKDELDKSQRKQRSKFSTNVTKQSIDTMRERIRSALEKQGIWGLMNESMNQCLQDLGRDDLFQMEKQTKGERDKAGASQQIDTELGLVQSRTKLRRFNQVVQKGMDEAALSATVTSLQSSTDVNSSASKLFPWRNKATSLMRTLAHKIPGASYFTRLPDDHSEVYHDADNIQPERILTPNLSYQDDMPEHAKMLPSIQVNVNLGQQLDKRTSLCQCQHQFQDPFSNFLRTRPNQLEAEKPQKLLGNMAATLLNPKLAGSIRQPEDIIHGLMALKNSSQNIEKNLENLGSNLKDMWQGIAEVLMNFMSILENLTSNMSESLHTYSPVQERVLWHSLEVINGSIRRLVVLTNAAMDCISLDAANYEDSVQLAKASLDVVLNILGPFFTQIISNHDNIDMLEFVQTISKQLSAKLQEMAEFGGHFQEKPQSSHSCKLESLPDDAVQKIFKAEKAIKYARKIINNLEETGVLCKSCTCADLEQTQFVFEDEVMKNTPVPVLERLCTSAMHVLGAISNSVAFSKQREAWLDDGSNDVSFADPVTAAASTGKLPEEAVVQKPSSCHLEVSLSSNSLDKGSHDDTDPQSSSSKSSSSQTDLPKVVPNNQAKAPFSTHSLRAIANVELISGCLRDAFETTLLSNKQITGTLSFRVPLSDDNFLQPLEEPTGERNDVVSIKVRLSEIDSKKEDDIADLPVISFLIQEEPKEHVALDVLDPNANIARRQPVSSLVQELMALVGSKDGHQVTFKPDVEGLNDSFKAEPDKDTQHDCDNVIQSVAQEKQVETQKAKEPCKETQSGEQLKD